MEQTVFQRPAVSRVLSGKFIEARLHTDHETLGDKWSGLEKEFIGYTGQSIYLVVDPERPKVMLRMTNYDPGYNDEPQEFVEWLEGRAEGK
jgi:hypothetical protein